MKLFSLCTPVALGRMGGRWLCAAANTAQRLLYPPFCTACAQTTEVGAHLCGECEAEALRLRWAAPAVCRNCSRPFWGSSTLPEVCVECLERKPAFGCVVAPHRFAGVVREVVHQFKYEGKRHLRGIVAGWMEEGLGDARLDSPPVDGLVPVPLHWWKQRLRGFNQAELLAGELSARGGIGVLNALRRVRPTATQTQLAREARHLNVRGAFRMRERFQRQITGRHLLLVDDVLTTGATLDACAAVLLGDGAASVRALTAARG